MYHFIEKNIQQFFCLLQFTQPVQIAWLLTLNLLLAGLFALVVLQLNLDIKRRQQIESALRESEEFNRSILESSADCIKVLQLDGTLISMNTPGLCLMEIEDFTPFIGKSWTDFWPEPHYEDARHAIETALRGGIGHFRGYCATAKGTPKWWDVMVTPMLNASGEVKLIISTSRDITQQKRDEEALLQSQERARQQLAELEAIYATDPVELITSIADIYSCKYG